MHQANQRATLAEFNIQAVKIEFKEDERMVTVLD
jgi:hypothetical protein